MQKIVSWKTFLEFYLVYKNEFYKVIKFALFPDFHKVEKKYFWKIFCQSLAPKSPEDAGIT